MKAIDFDALAVSFAAELERRTPLVDREVSWPSARLRGRTFIDDFDYPAELI